MKMLQLLMVLIVLSLSGFICHAQNNDCLYPRLVESSSYLYENDFIIKANYHPNYVIDDNPNTAWVEGISGDGINEHITMFTSLPKDENTIILIRNGYQKSEDLFFKNNRVHELAIILTSGTANSPKNYTYKFQLQDKMGWQTINIKPLEDSWAILFIIKSVYKGSKYEDTCISDIKITLGNPNLIDSRAQDELRRRYNSWFEERSKKAAFFSNLPKDYPFTAYKKTTYQKNVEEDSCPLFDIEYFNRVLKNEKLNRFTSSSAGIKYNKILSDKKFSGENICNISPKNKIYLPDILSENIFINIGKYLHLSNLKIIPDNSKTKIGDTIHKVLYVGKNIRAIDWKLLLNNKYEKHLSRNYYDDEGKLIYIKGDFSGEDGECANDALFVWSNGKIVQIFLFFVQWGNQGGLDVQMTVYE